MKTETFIPVKTVVLKNNCPECFSNTGLQLTFLQKFEETSFYKSITNIVQHEISCSNCNTTIYPERWTDDIERVFEYQQRAFEPRPSSRYFKRLFWILFISGLVALFIAIGGATFLMQ